MVKNEFGLVPQRSQITAFDFDATGITELKHIQIAEMD